jgi:hypothetical protein
MKSVTEQVYNIVKANSVRSKLPRHIAMGLLKLLGNVSSSSMGDLIPEIYVIAKCFKKEITSQGPSNYLLIR